MPNPWPWRPSGLGLDGLVLGLEGLVLVNILSAIVGSSECTNWDATLHCFDVIFKSQNAPNSKFSILHPRSSRGTHSAPPDLLTGGDGSIFKSQKLEVCWGSSHSSRSSSWWGQGSLPPPTHSPSLSTFYSMVPPVTEYGQHSMYAIVSIVRRVFFL